MQYSEKYTTLRQQLAAETDPRKQISILLNIGEEVKNFEVDEALTIAKEVVDRSASEGYTTGRAQGLCLKGFCYRLKGEYEAGEEVLKEALGIALRASDKSIEAVANYYLGNIYRDLGNLAEAYSHYARAQTINHELGDEYYEAVILAVISNLLFDYNDLNRALEYALKCLPVFERVNNVNSLLNVCSTLGNIYFKKQQYEEALRFFGANLRRSQPDTAAYLTAKSCMGKVYYRMQQLAEAKTYLSDALERSEKSDNVEVVVTCNLYLGCLHTDEGHHSAGLAFLQAALEVAEAYHRRQDLMLIYEKLSHLYEQTGDIPNAFIYIKKYEKLKDEIFKQNVLAEMHNMQVQQQIEMARKEREVAERAAEMKHKFLANMSHEIRTPMNAIVGMTRLILAKDPKQEHLRYLNAIRMSADNLLVIVNEILDFSKIEAGKATIEQIDFNLHEALQGLGDMLRTKSDEKDLELRIETSPDVPVMVKGDPTRLNQVLINLAGNAIKFTEKGYVAIKAVLERDNESGLVIRFDVKDTGIGIADKYIATIFDSFTQAGSDITRKFGGTGLGLNISKQLTTLMGGDIVITSELGKGSTFAATIVFERSDVQADAIETDTMDAGLAEQLRGLRVLLAEDNEFNRMVAEDTLAELIQDVQISVAVNGSEAVEQLKKETYDVVLMDIQMPVMDGVTATKTIRETLPAPAGQVKIIAMTANVMQEDVQQYLQAGMDGYVSKPFKPDELLRQLGAVTKGLELKPREAAAAPTPEPEVHAPVTDMHFITQFARGNEEKIKKYIGMFLGNAPLVLVQLRKGLEAGDHKVIQIAAHSLKPQLSYMGVKEEVSKVLHLENTASEKGDMKMIARLIDNLDAVCQRAFAELGPGN